MVPRLACLNTPPPDQIQRLLLSCLHLEFWSQKTLVQIRLVHCSPHPTPGVFYSRIWTWNWISLTIPGFFPAFPSGTQLALVLKTIRLLTMANLVCHLHSKCFLTVTQALTRRMPSLYTRAPGLCYSCHRLRGQKLNSPYGMYTVNLSVRTSPVSPFFSF